MFILFILFEKVLIKSGHFNSGINFLLLASILIVYYFNFYIFLIV